MDMGGYDGETSGPLEPPPLASEATALKVGLAGGALGLTAALLGIPDVSESASAVLTPLRAILSAMAMLIAGAAITLRYRWAPIWLIAGGVSLIAGFGFPKSFDSFRLVAFVFGGIAVVGALLAFLPLPWRMGVGTALALFHFSGIFVAVTSPPASPVLTNYLWAVIYRPYLQFAYLSNAYQFYSPDPGPASELWFCVYYESKIDDPVKMDVLLQTPDGQPAKDKDGLAIYKPMIDESGALAGEPLYDSQGKFIFKEQRDRFGNVLRKPKYIGNEEESKPDYLKTVRWIKIPRRERDFKDPLGQAYYRRLSLTEQLAHTNPLARYPDVEGVITSRRYTETASIPVDLKVANIQAQCQIPNQDTLKILLPSYLRYIARNSEKPDRAVAAVRVYRVLHNITAPQQFAGGPSNGGEPRIELMEPSTYMPYYLGKYDANGELLDPSDPMLYWLVPIRRRAGVPADDFNTNKKMTMADYNRLYEDFVAQQAESYHNEEELAK